MTAEKNQKLTRRLALRRLWLAGLSIGEIDDVARALGAAPTTDDEANALLNDHRSYEAGP